MPAQRKIRVLIAEDTLVGQHLLKGILADDPRFEVIGIAGNGKEAVDFVTKHLPDVVSMDIYMPEMDGIEATRRIMRNSPVPIVIVSSFYDANEVKMSFNILEAGALTILPKPHGPMHPEFNQTARTYRNTLKMMSAVNVSRTSRRTDRSPEVARTPVAPATVRTASAPKIIAIGASAGGPQAIEAILKGLPASLPVPVLIVQHIDAHFAEGYCDWLNSRSAMPVHIAINGEIMLPGHVYLPPGDHHLGTERENIITVTKNPPEKGLRPAVSYLFKNVNAVYGGNSVCILLSGMGTDGAAELKTLRDAGALTIAQDESSSLVHGMPGEAIRLGGAAEILSPVEIAHKIIEIVKPVK